MNEAVFIIIIFNNGCVRFYLKSLKSNKTYYNTLNPKRYGFKNSNYLDVNKLD